MGRYNFIKFGFGLFAAFATCRRALLRGIFVVLVAASGGNFIRFANLSHRDPHLENVNLNSRRDSAKFNLHAVQQHLTCSGDGWGFCVALLVAAKQTVSSSARSYEPQAK